MNLGLRLGIGMIVASVMTSASASPHERSAAPQVPGAILQPVAFAQLPGWQLDQHESALAAFLRGCAAPPALRAGLPAPDGLAAACAAAAAAPDADSAAARSFFERWFTPFRIVPASDAGFLTGYFEPEFPGSLERTQTFPTPLYGRPADLVTFSGGAGMPDFPGLQAARRLSDGKLEPFPTRRMIEETDVARDWPIVAWLRDPVDRFIMQVQGSARLRLPDGSVARVAYAGRNGHPYTSLGRRLSQAENIPPAEMTMDRLVARLKADPAWARGFIWNNASFVFFRLAAELDPAQGPIGGAGFPLTAQRSIAADRTIWPYGLPVWLSGQLPTEERGRTEPLQRLTVIQDTGSAIVGAARFDLFYGSGPDAGFVAGLTRHGVDAVVLWPKGVGQTLPGKR